MTIPTEICSIAYPGNGVQNVFVFNFLIPSASDGSAEIIVGLTPPSGIWNALPVDSYTVSGLDEPLGGSVTYPLDGGAIPAGSFLTIERDSPYVQLTAVSNQSFYPHTTEDMADYEILLIQQLAEKAGRSLMVPPGETIGMLPGKAARLGGKVLGFNPVTGDPIAVDGSGGGGGGGGGDVFGPGASVPGHIAVWADAGGHAIADGGVPIAGFANTKLSNVGVRAFGAKGDGTGDDSKAFTDADAAGALFVPPGNYRINKSIQLNNPMILSNGASLTVDGFTVTLRQTFVAPRRLAFNCINGGKVVVNPNTTDVAYPEWWGAQINNGGFDSLPSLQAAVASGVNKIHLATGTYYTQHVWKIQRGHVEVFGTPGHWASDNDCTRIIVMNGTEDVIQIGPDAKPGGGINAFQQENRFHSMQVARAAVPVGLDGQHNGPAGIKVQYTLGCRIYEITSSENCNGIWLRGVVYTHLEDNYLFRSTAGPVQANDFFNGILVDGTVDIGASAGNASVYINRCNCQLGGGPAMNTIRGIYLLQGWTDTFIDRFETTNIQIGIEGNASNQTPVGTQDLHITGCVLDACSRWGILLHEGNNRSVVNISDFYIAPSPDPAFTAGIGLINQQGMTSLSDGQVLGSGNQAPGAGALGVYCVNAEGVQILEGVLLNDCERPVGLSGCRNCRVFATVAMISVSSTGAAVTLIGGCVRCNIAPQLVGTSVGAFGQGVLLDSDLHVHCKIDCTGLDPTCILGGSPDKVHANGVAITVAGVFGTNGCFTAGDMT